jgi:hypothetical protein
MNEWPSVGRHTDFHVSLGASVVGRQVCCLFPSSCPPLTCPPPIPWPRHSPSTVFHIWCPSDAVSTHRPVGFANRGAAVPDAKEWPSVGHYTSFHAFLSTFVVVGQVRCLFPASLPPLTCPPPLSTICRSYSNFSCLCHHFGIVSSLRTLGSSL